MNEFLVDTAITLSGALAEAGIQTIESRCRSAAPWQTLVARVTDLPGLIMNSPEGAELRWQGGGARLEQGTLIWWGTAAGLPLPVQSH